MQASIVSQAMQSARCNANDLAEGKRYPKHSSERKALADNIRKRRKYWEKW